MADRYDMAHLFDLGKQTMMQGVSPEEWAEIEKREPDPDWHVPSLLAEEARLLRYHFQKRMETAGYQSRKADETEALELERYKLFRLVHEHLTEKYSAASRTLDLLREVQAGKKGFVLLLWGFGTRTWHLTGGTMSSINIDAQLKRDEIAEKLAPTPLLWIADPIESGAHELESERKLREMGIGFRIESGRNWEENVVLLINAASFIIVQNAEMTPGIVREINRVRDQRRLSDTFFDSPEKAQQICGSQDLNPLTEENIARMRSESTPRVVPEQPLPEPTCLWVEGTKRESMVVSFAELFNYLQTALKFRSPLPLDWLLDAYYYLIATAVLLERLDFLFLALDKVCGTLASIPVEKIPGGEALGKIYGNFVQDYQSALEKISTEQSQTAQLEQTYRYLRTRSGE